MWSDKALRRPPRLIHISVNICIYVLVLIPLDRSEFSPAQPSKITLINASRFPFEKYLVYTRTLFTTVAFTLRTLRLDRKKTLTNPYNNSSHASLSSDRIDRILTMVYNTQNYWGSEQTPPSGFLNTRKLRFGNWICFRPQVMGGRRLHYWVP
jgi:hypothetical protein